MLKSFLGYKLTNTPEVFDYLTDLLAVINQTDRRITDSKTAKKLGELYSNRSIRSSRERWISFWHIRFWIRELKGIRN